MLHKILKHYRIFKYRCLSEKISVKGDFICHQPILFKGKGRIEIGNRVEVGIYNSPNFYNTYAYLEARTEDSAIFFGNNIHINNNFSAIAFKANIEIQNDVVIGSNCRIITSDFHNLEAKNRNTEVTGKNVIIERNVFIGDNVTILKGVNIGENSVIGSGAVVTGNIPKNTVAAGNPARVIRNL
ncbi:acyltransferase [Leeuwenhoekiella sp. A16]|uniref:acyltransferase n=1 Tax=unclassified Leeuwenhoekiella TaxID=2615029 RepID=UPI003A802480